MRVQALEDMGLTEIYAVYDEGHGKPRRLVRRLDGVVRLIADNVFVPVEDFHTGERLDPNSYLLRYLTEMEVLAWASE